MASISPRNSFMETRGTGFEKDHLLQEVGSAPSTSWTARLRSLHVQVFSVPGLLATAFVFILGFMSGCVYERRDLFDLGRGSAHFVPDAVRRLEQPEAWTSSVKKTEASFLSPATAVWQDPRNPQIDELFDSFHRQEHMFLITEEEMRRLHKDPATHVRIPDDWGYGDKVFLTKFDTPHQIHCVDMLRKLLHREHYGMLEANHTSHGDHCILSLFNYLSCHGTTDVMNFVWVEGSARYKADFEVTRQCRDLSALYDFYAEHDVGSDARIRYLMASADDYVIPHDVSMDSYVPPESEARDRRMMFAKAMDEWRATGQIPHV